MRWPPSRTAPGACPCAGATAVRFGSHLSRSIAELLALQTIGISITDRLHIPRRRKVQVEYRAGIRETHRAFERSQQTQAAEIVKRDSFLGDLQTVFSNVERHPTCQLCANGASSISIEHTGAGWLVSLDLMKRCTIFNQRGRRWRAPSSHTCWLSTTEAL
jgi:hypothetical protein